MLKTSVVSTDWLGEMMVFSPEAESLGVPVVVAMRMPLPPGHPPTVLRALESVRGLCGVGVCAWQTAATQTSAPIAKVRTIAR
jgi:hypothetical protein